jgi:hypothetical protein
MIKSTDIKIQTAFDGTAGIFNLTSKDGKIELNNSSLIADGIKGTINLTTHSQTGSINLYGSKLSTVINEKINERLVDKDVYAGNIAISTNNLILGASTSIMNGLGSSITAETKGGGNGGSISLDAKSLTLSGGSQLTTQASSTGAAGVINLNITTPRPLAIAVSGDSLINASTTYTGILDPSKPDQQAQGGSIFIGTPTASLHITGAGRITAETRGSGNGGQLNLQGSSIAIDQTIATAQTSGTGRGGTINASSDRLNLSGGSQLTTEARNVSSSSAGDINLNAFTPRDLTITFSGKDTGGNYSKINAQTNSKASGDLGRGGNINIGTSNQKLTIDGDKTDLIRDS